MKIGLFVYLIILTTSVEAFFWFRTTGTLHDVRLLGEVPENPKSHREPCMDKLVTIISSRVVKVIGTLMVNELKEVTEIPQHSLIKSSI